MKVLAVAVGLGVLTAPTLALAQARGAAPQPTAPAAPRPAQPAAQTPAPPPVPQVQFQDGLKYAYLRVDVIAANSIEGRAANERVKALNDQKVRELNDRNKALQSAQQKLEQGGTVLNDVARAQLQQEVERQQRDIQRFTEDAQQDVQALQQQLQEDFQRKLNPVVDRVAREKQVHMVFSAADSGLVWADPTMDLTADVIRAFDAAATSKPAAAAPAPAPAAPAAAPAPTTPGAR